MKKNNKGFSLVELIVVIAIMAVLTGVLVPQLIRKVESGRKSVCINDMDNLLREYMSEIILREDEPQDVVEEIMTAHGLTKVDDNTYTGHCKSHGKYRVIYNEDRSIAISCTKHGPYETIEGDIEYYYLESLGSVFSDFFKNLSGDDLKKFGSSYTIDSTGFGFTDGSIVPKFTEFLDERGLKIPSTAIWKITYNKSKDLVNFYWYDEGVTITDVNKKVIGHQIQTDASGNEIGRNDAANINFKYNTKEGKTYLIIANNGQRIQ